MCPAFDDIFRKLFVQFPFFFIFKEIVQARRSPSRSQGICQEIKLQASKVATDITCERHYIKLNPSNPSAIEFGQRFFVFEFTYSLVLRKSQVILIHKFMNALRNNRSMRHQMIMGAVKTTVVTALLILMLADGNSVATQVVPHALLEFSRGAMTEKVCCRCAKGSVYLLLRLFYTDCS